MRLISNLMSDQQTNIEEFDKEAFLKALGAQIKRIRQEKRLTAAEFARRMYMERSHVSRLEAGGTNPTSTTLKIVCEALKINMSELFKDFKY